MSTSVGEMDFFIIIFGQTLVHYESCIGSTGKYTISYCYIVIKSILEWNLG